MAGLVAAIMAAQRGLQVAVFEAAPSLPNNHNAVLRFKTDDVAKAVNIPFKKVQMLRDVFNSKGVVMDAMAYSMKTTGTYRSDRSLSANGSGDRYVAPPDFIQQLYDRAINLGVKFEFLSPVTSDDWDRNRPTISTIPQLKTIELFNDYIRESRFENDFFSGLLGKHKSIPGAVAKVKLKKCEAWVTRYTPHDTFFNRISISGDEVIAEASFADTHFDITKDVAYRSIMHVFDLDAEIFSDVMEITQSKYSKILPIEDDKSRKAFISWMTDNFNTYSLGRFATWRPGMLLDALPQDVNLILGWIENGHYNTKMKR